MPLDGSTPTAPAACPWQPRPRPHRCVWRSSSQVSPWTCSPAQLQAQFSFLFNPQINMCSYIFNREAVFIRVGISVTSFSPLLRRHPALTWKMSGFMRKRPGEARETDGHHSWLGCCPFRLGPVILPFPSSPSPWPSLAPSSCWRPHAGKLPGVLPDLLSTLPQLRARRTRANACSRSPSASSSRRIDFPFQLQVKAERNKLSPFHSVITVTLCPSCHLLLHQNPHLAKLEGRRGHVDL